MKNRLLVVTGLLAIGFTCGHGQSTKGIPRLAKSKDGGTNQYLSAKSNLEAALSLSQKQKSISLKVEVSVQCKLIVSLFEYLAPNRFYMVETNSGAPSKEAIEVAVRRYQKKKDQWVKVRRDPYPLREQFLESFFPMKFVSERRDLIKIRRVEVKSLGSEVLDGKKYSKYSYSITYKDFNSLDSGVAWVSQDTGFLEYVESDGAGIFGPYVSKWSYSYDKGFNIEPPTSFVEKDWID